MPTFNIKISIQLHLQNGKSNTVPTFQQGDSLPGQRCSCCLQTGRVASDLPPSPAALLHLLVFPARPLQAFGSAAIARPPWSFSNHLEER